MTDVLDNDTKIKAGYMFAGTLTGVHEKLDALREGNDPRNPLDHNIEQAQIALENAVMRIRQVLIHLGAGDELTDPPDGDPLDYWTVHEIADKLRVSKMTVYRMTENGVLPAFKVGRHIRVTKKAFATYLEGLQK